jgi:adenylate kinase family enzyme
MVVMMGVPGSGKSTLAKRLIEAYPEFVRVNQDEMKTR